MRFLIGLAALVWTTRQIPLVGWFVFALAVTTIGLLIWWAGAAAAEVMP
jgi:hypothetical protein